MIEIGATLREARIRLKIDISVVEEHTKIRAKYLRALENEEWALLPGPTFARSFLRTYAEFLGLDAQRLIDGYRQQFGSSPEAELFQYTEPPLHEHMPPGGGYQGPRIGRGLVMGALVLGLLAFLAILGLTGGAGERESVDSTQASTPIRTATTPPARTRQRRPAPVARQVRAQINAAADVWVCLVDHRGRRLIDAEVIPAGRSRGPYRGRRFKVTFGNGQVALRVNGRPIDVPETSAGIGYEITPRRVKTLSSGSRPSCT